MRPQIVSDALVQTFVCRLQGGLLQGLAAAGAEQLTDELQGVAAQRDDLAVNAHLVAACAGKGVHQQQGHIGAGLWVERGQIAINAGKPLGQQVGQFFVLHITGCFEGLQQFLDLVQVVQQIFFECAGQHFGQ